MRRLSFLRFLIFCAVLAPGLLGVPDHAAAHPELERADPPPDGLLAAPPRRLELWVSEAVDAGAGSPSLRLLDAAGRELPVRGVALDPADPRHVRADVAGVGTGTYTVVWSARSAVDGHTLSGTYAFRVGTGQAPGAATVEGEVPTAWAVATRWLTFLGAALAAGGFAFARLVLRDGGERFQRRRLCAVVAGATVALLATLAEPVLQTRWPPAGALAPELGEAIRGVPTAWWLRPAALIPALLLGLGALVRRRRGRWLATADWAGLGFSLAALLGLGLTSHAAARETWMPLALGSNVLHQWAVALWVGGLVHLALAWPERCRTAAPVAGGATPPSDPVRRFSRLALGLVAVGVGTGALNAGLVLPTLRSLWASTYGTTLLVKVAALIPPLALATFNRAALRRTVERAGGALRKAVRAEAALVLLVALGGSVLALLAPPAIRAATPLDLAAPAGTDDLLVHLQIRPARPGENTVAVALSDADGVPLPLPPATEIELDFTSLNHDVAHDEVEAQPTGAGAHAAEGAQLGLDGWWRVGVTVRRPDQPDLAVPFYLRLPDPNVSPGRVRIPPSSDEAEAVFRRGLVGLSSLRTVRYTQRLAGGTGTVVVSENAVDARGEGRPPASTVRLTSGTFAMVRVGDREWLRQGDGAWTEREASPFIPPAQWAEDYEGATGFRLGRVEEVGGEPARVVSFVVPATERRAAAWYAWWVGLESGRVLREAMVSRWHYMVAEYRDFDAPLAIEPPIAPGPGTPAATPVSGASQGSL